MHEIKAPFTDAQVEALNDWQRWGPASAIRCPKHGETKLVAKTDGWHCPVEGCGETRNWAPEFILRVKYCLKTHPRPADAPSSDYWVHVDAVDINPEWEGDVVPYHCPNCGLDFEVEY